VADKKIHGPANLVLPPGSGGGRRGTTPPTKIGAHGATESAGSCVSGAYLVETTMRTSMILLAAMAIPAPALAQAAGSPDAPAPGGSISREAYLARQTARIMAADTDGDGRISRAEMTAAAQGKRDPAPMFDRMDRNGDGVLTPDERMQGHGSAQDGSGAGEHVPS
jgi:hypothetical protein